MATLTIKPLRDERPAAVVPALKRCDLATTLESLAVQTDGRVRVYVADDADSRFWTDLPGAGNGKRSGMTTAPRTTTANRR